MHWWRISVNVLYHQFTKPISSRLQGVKSMHLSLRLDSRDATESYDYLFMYIVSELVLILADSLLVNKSIKKRWYSSNQRCGRVIDILPPWYHNIVMYCVIWCMHTLSSSWCPYWCDHILFIANSSFSHNEIEHLDNHPFDGLSNLQIL